LRQIKKYIEYINKPLNSFNFINILGLLFWLSLISSVLIILIISFQDSLSLQISTQGFNNLFNIYKFPFYILAVALAVITLRITLIRVSQTDKQLEAIYKPELYIDKGTLWVVPTRHGDNYKFAFTDIRDNVDRLPELKIFNVGFAAAIQVKYNFEYNIEKAIKILKEKDNSKEFDITYYSSYELVLSSNVQNLRDHTYYVKLENRERSSNFLLSATGENIYLGINLPTYYCHLYTIFLYLMLRDEANPNKILEKEFIRKKLKDAAFPILKLNISYKDLANNKFNKIFNIELVSNFFYVPFVHNTVNIMPNMYLIEPKDVTLSS